MFSFKKQTDQKVYFSFPKTLEMVTKDLISDSLQISISILIFLFFLYTIAFAITKMNGLALDANISEGVSELAQSIDHDKLTEEQKIELLNLMIKNS